MLGLINPYHQVWYSELPGYLDAGAPLLLLKCQKQKSDGKIIIWKN